MNYDLQREILARNLSALKDLIGGTVVETIRDKEGFFGLAFQMPDGTKRHLWILGDDEANHPGAVEVTKAE